MLGGLSMLYRNFHDCRMNVDKNSSCEISSLFCRLKINFHNIVYDILLIWAETGLRLHNSPTHGWWQTLEVYYITRHLQFWLWTYANMSSLILLSTFGRVCMWLITYWYGIFMVDCKPLTINLSTRQIGLVNQVPWAEFPCRLQCIRV